MTHEQNPQVMAAWIIDKNFSVSRNARVQVGKQEGRFSGHFSRVVVSDFRSLRGDIVSELFRRANLRRQKSRFKLEKDWLIARVREASSRLRIPVVFFLDIARRQII